MRGFRFAAAPTEEGTFTLLPMIRQAGGDVPTIGDRAGIDALTMVDTLVNVDHGAPRGAGLGPVRRRRQFAADRCAMMVNSPWVLPPVTTGGIDFAVARGRRGPRHRRAAGW
ncbi:MAG TPA: hypothetical protein VGX25_24905 [Actinophytocola sp.]|uniref:hypothetical protein n=1 Tax=Actinophytocola sp. TaxID=1872138 RepID=UPI002DDCC7EF|nr:hypothetical protein [Actinophytocola sp.]HEV2782644.1 hypothetical protein [Actinophytocola sp.]